MAKNMARIEDGMVVNIESWNDAQPETDELVDTGDKPVGIGDTYTDGKFYRDGAEVLSVLEEAQAELADAKAALELLGVTE